MGLAPRLGNQAVEDLADPGGPELPERLDCGRARLLRGLRVTGQRHEPGAEAAVAGRGGRRDARGLRLAVVDRLLDDLDHPRVGPRTAPGTVELACQERQRLALPRR